MEKRQAPNYLNNPLATLSTPFVNTRVPQIFNLCPWTTKTPTLVNCSEDNPIDEDDDDVEDYWSNMEDY
ncbi:hypothetical protein CEXT_45621 [Caerostris extrusa]|uniref:Uncharacterized protein n=1 Tax=Caerostris extrusa TaxID=172846 RepID=A0AAV4MLM9_CAEEX|nr:hypothetical protein CEXT_45621 [Caerostris extrusa]